ncbi:MAG: hypothetical protein K5Q00_04460 [Gammaproteobacteria bacterium]|nr:hypothetical protein [Gammaproteobacteria bacterium]
MKTLLKTLFLATVVSCASTACADPSVAINFFDINGNNVNATGLTGSQDFFVELINTNPSGATVVFHSEGAIGSGSDIQVSNLTAATATTPDSFSPASGLTFVHPGYTFASCVDTSYSTKYQPTNIPPAGTQPNPGPGVDGNMSFCLVRLHYTKPTTGTAQPLQISALNTATVSHGAPTSAILILN